MALFDLTLDELRTYRADQPEPDDFDDFWRSTLAEARAAAWAPRIEPIDNGLALMRTGDVAFAGYGGDAVRAWWTVPADREPSATVVEFIGYSGGRGLPHQVSEWVAAGYAHLRVDTRGQGWSQAGIGATADPHGSGPAAPGMLTRGIESPESYYYRRVFADAARAVDTARELAGAARPLFVTGASQGGGLAIAAAALARVDAVMPDVPFLCHFPRAITITGSHPYQELVTFLAAHRHRVDETLRTLSYFDGVHLAARATAPALFSVALMDPICPPSTVFAAYNAWGSEARDIEVYPFNGHEGGGAGHRRAQLDWLRPQAG